MRPAIVKVTHLHIIHNQDIFAWTKPCVTDQDILCFVGLRYLLRCAHSIKSTCIFSFHLMTYVWNNTCKSLVISETLKLFSYNKSKLQKVNKIYENVIRSTEKWSVLLRRRLKGRSKWCKHTIFITARKRSLGQGNIFTPVCHSVDRGGLPQCMLGYHPRTMHTSPQDHAPPGPCTTPPGTMHPPWDHAPPAQRMLGDTVNVRVVRILLECNLVLKYKFCCKMFNLNNSGDSVDYLKQRCFGWKFELTKK